VVIPAELRRKYNLKPGKEVLIVDYGGVLAIIPQLDDSIDQAAGMLKSDKVLTKILMEEHAGEQ
jgi:AbrB family looped-hinge helix DNA binding protein